MKANYDTDQVMRTLARRGVKMGRVPGTDRQLADASRLNVVGIDTLGKLDFLNGKGFDIELPPVDHRRSLKRR